MSTLRVRAFYTRYPHMGAHSGFQQVCRHLDAGRVEVSLIAVSDSDDDWPIVAGPVNRWLRSRIVRRGMAWYKLSDLAAEISAMPAAAVNGMDIVHFLDAEHTAQYLPRWTKRWPRSRVKTVGTFHQPPELLPTLVNPKIVEALDRVLLVSPSQEAYFRQFLPPERVETILHGVDAEFFRPARERVRDGIFRCITVGFWMRDWRAIRAVAERLAPERDIEFHIVTNRATGAEHLSNVRRHQNVDDAALRRLYQDADVLFLPLENATANNCLLEGLACGLPVVSTRIESVMAYVGDDAAYLVAGNDPSELASAILLLRDGEGLGVRMGEAARARAEQLAWPRMAREFERTYAALCGDRTRPSS